MQCNRLLQLQVRIKELFRTQSDFCTQLGISDAELSRVLNGRKKLKKHLLQKIEALLQCETSAILPDGYDIEE